MLQSILLQLQTSGVSEAAPAAATTEAQGELSLLSILMMGGPIMIPILLLLSAFCTSRMLVK